MRTRGRGTSNANERGNTKDRARRRAWILNKFQVLYPGVCQCYRCLALLTEATMTIDRIIPGCRGGRYTPDNIRPACSTCNSSAGGSLRRAA